MYTVYIMECSDHSLYTGITNDLENRLKQHSSGKGSRYVRSRLPVRIVFTEQYENRSDALKREMKIKKLTRQEKLELISQSETGNP